MQISRYDVLQTYEHGQWNALKTSHWKVNCNAKTNPCLQNRRGRRNASVTGKAETYCMYTVPRRWAFQHKHIPQSSFIFAALIIMKKFNVRIVLCHHIISALLFHRADPQYQPDGEFQGKSVMGKKAWAQKTCGRLKHP